jgi:hypothetical protein
VITLAVTILRLAGELQHWSKPLFSPSAGGGLALVGISWLPIVFGPYFAMKLAGAGEGSSGTGKTIGFVVLGIVVFIAGVFAFAPIFKFPGKEILGLVLMAASALIPLAPWPALGKALIAYGYAARIPVAIVMYFAFQGNWGTHYDALPPGFSPNTPFWPKYAELALFPQLVSWIAYTVLVGMLFGTIIAALARRGKTPAQATT